MGFRVSPQVNEERAALLTRIVQECFEGKNAALGRRLGYADGSFIGQMRRQEKPVSESILEKLMAIPEARRITTHPGGAGLPGAAHPVSHLVAETVPSITWEQIKMSVAKDGLPAVFRVQMVDSAMAPRAGTGAWVQFSSTETARPGDGVLVRDALGNQYFRQYRSGRPGCWEAHADNSAFATLDSERDGLEVLAVLTAVEARWG